MTKAEANLRIHVCDDVLVMRHGQIVERRLPKLAQKMQVNAVPPSELKKFAATAQPAVRKLIEEKLGAEGVDMLNAMLAAIDEAQQ